MAARPGGAHPRAHRQPARSGSGRLTLDLSTSGSFSLSLDEHARLLRGTASRTEDAVATRWTLQPIEPPWTTNRTVTATLTWQAGSYSLDNEIGDP